MKKSTAIILVIVTILFLLGSCSDSGSSGKSSGSSKLVSGTCSHCYGRGVSKYGNECAWCNGTGYWAYYD